VVAVANAAAELSPLGVPAVLAEHASHLCVCSQTTVEITHIYIKSDSAVFQHKKRCMENLYSTEQLIIFTNNFSDKEESGNKWITQLNN
jgi:L-asparaginase II